MGRIKENPRYNVISFRVSDEELAEMEKIMKRDEVSTISELLLGVVVSWLEVARG